MEEVVPVVLTLNLFSKREKVRTDRLAKWKKEALEVSSKLKTMRKCAQSKVPEDNLMTKELVQVEMFRRSLLGKF